MLQGDKFYIEVHIFSHACADEYSVFDVNVYTYSKTVSFQHSHQRTIEWLHLVALITTVYILYQIWKCTT